MHTGGRGAFGQPSATGARRSLLRPTVEMCTCRAQLRSGHPRVREGLRGRAFHRGAAGGGRGGSRVAWAPPAVRGTGMEPTESAAPGSRLRLRGAAAVWRRRRANGRPGTGPADRSGTPRRPGTHPAAAREADTNPGAHAAPLLAGEASTAGRAAPEAPASEAPARGDRARPAL